MDGEARVTQRSRRSEKVRKVIESTQTRSTSFYSSNIQNLGDLLWPLRPLCDLSYIRPVPRLYFRCSSIMASAWFRCEVYWCKKSFSSEKPNRTAKWRS